MAVNEITNGAVTHLGVAITWGLIVMAMICTFGSISGAHFNPAVTIAFAFAKKFAWKEVPKYVTAQVGLSSKFVTILLSYFFTKSSQFYFHF